MRNFSIKNTVWKNRGHEFDEIADNIFLRDKRYYIYGLDKENSKLSERMTSGVKSGKVIVIKQKEDVVFESSSIVICTFLERKEYEEAVHYFSEIGFQENRNLFQGEVFRMLYDVYVRNEIRIDRIEIFLTSCCTLNCEKCIAYIPYFKKVVHTPLEQLKQDADILFSQVDFVEKIKVLGGEGLLYPNLIEYLDYLHEHYGEKIGSIRIGTNGTILPNQKILKMCKRNNVTMDISDYTNAVPELCKLEEVRELCVNNGVAVDIKRTGEQWLDMGFPNNIPPEKTEEELKNHFEKCAMFCRQYSNGKLYYCCSNFAAVHIGLFPDDENNYFDLRKSFMKTELMEYEIGFCNLGHTTFCNVCNGGAEELNPYHVEVAKQLKGRL